MGVCLAFKGQALLVVGSHSVLNFFHLVLNSPGLAGMIETHCRTKTRALGCAGSPRMPPLEHELLVTLCDDAAEGGGLRYFYCVTTYGCDRL